LCARTAPFYHVRLLLFKPSFLETGIDILTYTPDLSTLIGTESIWDAPLIS
jgi:hypothetical protein